MLCPNLQVTDPEVFTWLMNELNRQREVINMIPSENYVSKAVLEACGSVANNKYSEGYPKKRYYQGNHFVDEAEILAIERAKKLFGAEHANVQSYSGSPANMAVFFGLLNPGDKIMGMRLDMGGHLTHGHGVNFSSKFYKSSPYVVDKATGLIDMDDVRRLAIKEKPKMIISGGTAYPRIWDFHKFQEIADEVGAFTLADISHIAGLVAGCAHPSPFPFTDAVMTTTHKTLRGPRGAMIMCKEKYAKQIDRAVFPGLQGGPHNHVNAAKAVCFGEALKPDFRVYAHQIVKNAKVFAKTLMDNGVKLVTDGTDNHLILIDLTDRGVGLGAEVAVALEKAGFCTNKNTIPYDPSTPFKPSGVRIGTPIMTTRGMKEDEMKLTGEWFAKVVNNYKNEELLKKTCEQVKDLCIRFPFY
jgi:glycine hydroxymethyltransferase